MTGKPEGNSHTLNDIPFVLVGAGRARPARREAAACRRRNSPKIHVSCNNPAGFVGGTSRAPDCPDPAIQGDSPRPSAPTGDVRLRAGCR